MKAANDVMASMPWLSWPESSADSTKYDDVTHALDERLEEEWGEYVIPTRFLFQSQSRSFAKKRQMVKLLLESVFNIRSPVAGLSPKVQPNNNPGLKLPSRSLFSSVRQDTP